MNHSFLHLGCPHQQGAHHGDPKYADQARPVDEMGVDLEMADDGCDEPRQDEADQILVARDRVIL